MDQLVQDKTDAHLDNVPLTSIWFLSILSQWHGHHLF